MRNSFSFTCANLQALATHIWVATHGLRNAALCKRCAGVRGDSYSAHDNPILLLLQWKLKLSTANTVSAAATVLHTATDALVHCTFELYALVWCPSAHACLIDNPINNALRIVTGCWRPTPMDDLFILAGVEPTEIHRQKSVLSLARRPQEQNTSYIKGSCLNLVDSFLNLNQDTHLSLLHWNCRTALPSQALV